MKRNKYPVGATWKFTAPEGSGIVSGAVGTVWLNHIHENGLEHWRWSFRYKGNKISKGDWTPTRKLAVEECRTCFMGLCEVRFRRVQEEETEDESLV